MELLLLVLIPAAAAYFIFLRKQEPPANPLAAEIASQISGNRLREEQDQLFSTISAKVREHGATLLRKRRMYVFRDDYGNLMTEKWDAEVKYFTTQVLMKDPLIASHFENTLRSCTEDSKDAFWVKSVDTILDDIERGFDPDDEEDIRYALEQASPEEFERVCGALLSKHGWKVIQVGGTGDHGADLVGERDGVRVVFQCKKYGTPVGNSAVQEVLAGKLMHGANIAAVIATRGYTISARDLAQAGGVHLLGITDLVTFHTAIGIEQ